jgi:putative transposon-encoded protein
MRNPTMTPTTRINVEGIRGFLIRKVTRFGNGAKVDCPKEYLGQTVYLVVLDHED